MYESFRSPYLIEVLSRRIDLAGENLHFLENKLLANRQVKQSFFLAGSDFFRNLFTCRNFENKITSIESTLPMYLQTLYKLGNVR